MPVISVPSVGGLQNSVMDYAVGAVAGIIHTTATQFTGNGLLGGAIAAAVTGATVKGNRGETVVTMIGYNSFAGNSIGGLLGGFGIGGTGSGDGEAVEEVL